MILVAGSTGDLGSEICRQLRAGGHRTCALARESAPRIPALRDLGVEIRLGDLKDPASLDRACAGAEAVITTVTCVASRRPGDTLRTVDHDGQLALVEAARRAGVRRFVYTSVSPNLSTDTPLVKVKRELERAVRASGMAWTILQPSKFMEIWLGPKVGWDLGRGRLTIFGPGHSPTSYVATADVARVAVLAAERADMAGRKVALGGPEALTELAAARIMEDLIGRRLQIRHVPLPILRAGSALARPFDPILASLLGMGLETAVRGDVLDMTALQRELSLELETVRENAIARTARAGSVPRAPEARA